MTTRKNSRVRANGKEFLDSGLNVTDNPLLVPFNEMTTAENILVGSTLARKKRPGQDYFNTDDSDQNASYPTSPANNAGADGDPIIGLYEFWRYDTGSGAPKTTLLVRQAAKIWAIDARTGLATDITGALTLPTTGHITFQAFEGRVYWASTNTAEGYNVWTGTGVATAVVNIGATFDAAVPGVTGNVELSADTLGTIGNLILLTGDGATDLDGLVTAWNAANPTNTVTLDSANGSDVPNNLEAMQLAGGENHLPPDGIPAYILSHGGRMFAFGVPGFPYRLYYSEFFDGQTWATAEFGSTGTAAEAGSLDFDPFGDPVGINGAVSFQDKLYVFMQRALFELSGNNIGDFLVKTINRQIGCVGHHTIVPVGNDVIYASERGVLRLSSTDKAIQSDFAFESRKISRLLQESIDRTLIGQYSASFDEQENLYLLSVPSSGSTTNDTILALNIENKVWTTWTGHKARTLATYIIDGANRVICGREDGVISTTGEPIRLDLGAAYVGRLTTGILFPGGEMDVQWQYHNVTVLASTDGKGSLGVTSFVDSVRAATDTFEVESGKDLLGTTFILGQSQLGNGVFRPQTFMIGDTGYGLQIEVVFNGDADIELYGFLVDAVAADHRIAGGA